QRVADALTDGLLKARLERERSSLLIAGIAHELRSPIQNLLGETEVLLMRDRSLEEYRAVLVSHSDEIQDLAREIDNLVTLCAHESNQESSSRESFDLGHEIELRLPRELIRAKRHKVDIQAHSEGDLAMTGDREALLLMVRNLVGNAIAHSPEGGVIHVSATGMDGEICLTVEDQGPGVRPENRESIFEPFQRGQDLPGTRAGFGLGLALSREAVRSQGGRLTVSDSPHGGACFEARLPNGRVAHLQGGASEG
ncbi:MAG: HAMP domain-containing sensor histidine kinase, partial [Planctomycetota bacterium]|nr:HAMP domain-containing sensor histidine kinase [Planctomycetota bacterium]